MNKKKSNKIWKIVGAIILAALLLWWLSIALIMDSDTNEEMYMPPQTMIGD